MQTQKLEGLCWESTTPESIINLVMPDNFISIKCLLITTYRYLSVVKGWDNMHLVYVDHGDKSHFIICGRKPKIVTKTVCQTIQTEECSVVDIISRSISNKRSINRIYHPCVIPLDKGNIPIIDLLQMENDFQFVFPIYMDDTIDPEKLQEIIDGLDNIIQEIHNDSSLTSTLCRGNKANLIANKVDSLIVAICQIDATFLFYRVTAGFVPNFSQQK